MKSEDPPMIKEKVISMPIHTEPIVPIIESLEEQFSSSDEA